MKNRIILLAVAAIMALAASAVPAMRKVLTVMQPDGTELLIMKHGDENFNYITTADGKLLARDSDGKYCYASFDSTTGALVSSHIMAVNAEVRSLSASRVARDAASFDMSAVQQKRLANKMLPQRRIAPYRATAPFKAIPQTGMGRYTTNFPTKGKIKALVLLVEYSDVKFNRSYAVSPKDYFSKLMMENGFSQYGGTGCAAEYFRDQSQEQFDPQFDVVGPITLDNNRNYYGANDPATGGIDKNAAQMVVHACEKADAQINFQDYDNDNDGVVDNVFIFYAGQGEATYGPEDSVWPHSWDLFSAGLTLQLDGVWINRYACSNEWKANTPDGIGTFVHEFSHVLGLPDLYNTSGQQASYTPGPWNVMDYGPYNNNGCTPPAFSAYERNAMGWIDLKVLSGPQAVKLGHIAQTNEACIINTDKKNEFFLFENRQQTGWDKFLPSHGMLIWHIDFDQAVYDRNVVNNKAEHQYVDLVEAGGSANSFSSSTVSTYTWPGSRSRTSFTSSTTPAMKSWSGKAIALPITEITEAAGIISFNVDGGKAIPAASNLTIAEQGQNFFVAKWAAAPGAVDYRLTVTGIKNDGVPSTVINNMGTDLTEAKMPPAWTSNTTAVYTTEGFYASAAPSLKLANNDDYVETPLYGSGISRLDFWYRGDNTRTSGSTVVIKGNDGTGKWTKLDAVTPVAGASGLFTMELPQGVRQIRLSYVKAQGNVAIDDIMIVTNRSEQILPDYNDIRTGGATSMRVAHSLGSADKYRFSVVAVHGTEGSYEYSKPITSEEFQVGVDTGLSEANTTPNSEEWYNLQGTAVGARSLTPGLYIRRQGSTLQKVIVR